MPRHNIFYTSIFTLFLLVTTSCNNEVFISPLTVTPPTNTIQWTGGAGLFTADRDISQVDIVAYRWVNGHGVRIGDTPMQQYLSFVSPPLRIENELCDISIAITDVNRLEITSVYNYFPDTIYFHLDIHTQYESVERAARILPSPGFGHSDIDYTLSSWEWSERVDTVSVRGIYNPTDETQTVRLMKQGDILAQSAGQFDPWQKLVGENIFGRQPFKVQGVTFDLHLQEPALLPDSLLYSVLPQKNDIATLTLADDLNVTVEPKSSYVVAVVVRSDIYGIYYKLDAINPLDDSRIETNGKYRITIPQNYEIVVTERQI